MWTGLKTHSSLEQHLNNMLLAPLHCPEEGSHAGIVLQLHVTLAAQEEEQSITMALSSSMMQGSLAFTVLGIYRHLDGESNYSLHMALLPQFINNSHTNQLPQYI